MTILYVDDDREDYEVFAEAVNHLSPSSNCVWADSCTQALKVLEGKKLPDYLFLDSIMPGEGGLDCVRRIRAEKRLKNITIVIYTGMIPEHDKILYRDFGVELFWKKTNTFNELVTILSSIFPKDKDA